MARRVWARASLVLHDSPRHRVVRALWTRCHPCPSRQVDRPTSMTRDDDDTMLLRLQRGVALRGLNPILRELFRQIGGDSDGGAASSPASSPFTDSPAASAASGFGVGMPSDGSSPSAGAMRRIGSRRSTFAPASSPAFDARLAPLEYFRDAARRGDAQDFVLLVCEAFSTHARTPWPLCDSCMETTLKARQKEVEAALAERDAVAALEHAMREMHVTKQGAVVRACEGEHEHGASAQSLIALRRDAASVLPKYAAAQKARLEPVLASLATEEEALEREIAQLHARARALTEAHARLDAADEAVDSLEASTWLEYMVTARSVASTRDRMNTLRERDVRLRDSVALHRYLSVHNDAFFIWHRGPFVTINGCRLGRLPAQPVDWNEINAALGQTALLLTTVATRVGYSFQKYRIIPLGSFSRIAAIGDEKSTHDLFYDSKYFAARRLNYALKAMCLCIGELGEFAQNRDKSFRLPYPVTHGGEKVADLHVTLGKEPQWTRAMKCALTNLKWLLAWAYRQPE